MATISEILEKIEEMDLTEDDKEVIMDTINRRKQSKKSRKTNKPIRVEEKFTEDQILIHDKQMRYVGIPGVEGLVVYDNIPLTEYKGEYICLKYHSQKLANQKLDITLDMINTILGFEDDFNYDNILIAGGFISSCIIGNKFQAKKNDIDIFIYGLSPDQATEKVKELLGSFGSDFIIRNENVVMCGQFQIILRCYTSISEILHGFDLGSCAVGFDGKQIWMTKLAHYSYAHMVNLVDLSRRSTTYEYRLMKYLYRDFDIVIPGIKNYKYGDLPFLEKFYSSAKLNGVSIYITPIHMNKQYSDYCNSDIGPKYSNLQYLLGTGKYIYHHGYEKLENTANILNEEFIKHAYQRLLMHFKQENFSAKKFNKYLPEYNIRQIVLMSESEFIQAIEQKIANLIIKANEIQKKSNEEGVRLHWRVENPGSQLVGSFNPALIEWSEWYKPINPMTEL